MADRPCKLHNCSHPASRKIVYNPVGEPRVTEYYCRKHATAVAEDALDDAYGDLFLGPVDIGFSVTLVT